MEHSLRLPNATPPTDVGSGPSLLDSRRDGMHYAQRRARAAADSGILPRVMKLSLLALGCLLPLAACASGERMIRLSPFGDAEPDPERTNVWPLFYADGDRRALLWPLADWDNQGFAVRPLVARDQDDLDLLWPLAHVELDDGSFWALSAYYDAPTGSYGLAPLAGWGQLRFVGPVWWTDDAAAPSHGLFPLYWRHPATDTTVVAPLYFDFQESFTLAPFWWHSRTSDSQVLFPLWWNFESEDGVRQSRTLLPLWQRTDDGRYHHWITLVGGRGWSDDGAEEFINVLGPLYHRSERGDAYTYTAVAWPLFASERDGERRSMRLSPLWAHASDPATQLDETELLLGLWRKRDDASGTSWRAVPLASYATDSSHTNLLDVLTLASHERSPEGTSTRVLGSLLLSLERSDPDEHGECRSWSTLIGWLLHLEHDSTPVVEKALESWRAEHATDSHFERETQGFLFDWFLWERTKLVGVDLTEQDIAHHRRVPLLWESTRTREHAEWDTALWFLHSTETEQEERFVAGWGLYRSVTRGEHTTRDIFPFMTWDKSRDETRFSFLGRVFDWRRKGRRSGGHVLFVPFGDEL